MASARWYYLFYLGNQGFGGQQQGYGNPGVNPGYGGVQGQGYGGIQGQGFQQPGMQQQGFQQQGGFNTWGNTGTNYQQMNGFNAVNYSGGWNPNQHDQMLRNQIDQVYMRYDTNQSGTL